MAQAMLAFLAMLIVLVAFLTLRLWASSSSYRMAEAACEDAKGFNERVKTIFEEAVKQDEIHRELAHVAAGPEEGRPKGPRLAATTPDDAKAAPAPAAAGQAAQPV